MSDTPRTQAAWETWIANGCAQRLKQESEKLERELAAVTKERDEWKDIANRALDSVKDFAVENRQIAQALQDSIARIKRLEDELTEVKAHNARLIDSAMAAWARVDDEERS